MRILVVGLGNLGGPLAELLAEAGHEVHGYDVNPEVAVPAEVTFWTGAAVQMPYPEMTFIVVPTPSRPDGTYDTRLVEAAARSWAPICPILVVVSTVLPGDCEALLQGVICRRTHIIYSPEFIRLGHVREDMVDPDFVLIGADEQAAGDKVEEVLQSILFLGPRWEAGCMPLPPIVRLSVIEAELAKIALNTFVTAKISFANMIGEMAEKLGADAVSVCHAIGFDRRIGHEYLRPGGAYQGPCFPRDNRALAALAARLGLTAAIAEATDAINERTAERIGYFAEDTESGRGY